MRSNLLAHWDDSAYHKAQSISDRPLGDAEIEADNNIIEIIVSTTS